MPLNGAPSRIKIISAIITVGLFALGSYLISSTKFFSHIEMQTLSSMGSPQCTEISESQFSYEYLRDLVKDPRNKINSIEDVLCRLPKKYRKHYGLGFESPSLQQGTPDNPRAVLFDLDDPSKLIMTFNGDSNESGYKNLEIMRRTKVPGQIIELIDFDFTSGRPIITENNPKKCLSCHGNPLDQNYPARPIFNANPVWPGYYGGSAQFMKFFKPELQKFEEDHFASFREKAKKHPRYKFLENLDEKNLNQEFEGNKALASILRQFTNSLAELNHKRVLKFILESPYYDRYKYAILGVLGPCEDKVEEFLPPQVRQWHNNESFLYAELQGQMNERKIDAVLEKRAKDSLGSVTIDKSMRTAWHERLETGVLVEKFFADTYIRQRQYGANTNHTIELRYLMEGRADPVSMRDWNIDVDRGMYRFNNNNKFIDHDIVYIIPELQAADPQLASFDMNFPEGAASDKDRNDRADRVCKQLIDASRNAFENFNPNIISPREITLPPQEILITKCSTCHSTGAQKAPLRSFDQPGLLLDQMKLKGGRLSKEICRRLTASDGDIDQMPPIDREGLSKKELQSILDYLKTLNPEFNCR